jgi:hypothetical protein
MNKTTTAWVLSVGFLLLVSPASAFVPRPAAEPRAAAPWTAGAGIAKKAKAGKKAADKKAADKTESEDESAKKKPFPTKAEALKDIDDISKK